ncbi:uncharacterized protein LOC111882003 [Lactuca sativa]|uniref:uncharacterized protein LOC111882003 n=1 Tax=Lactuca sativa TaxID=4236 RepID=UPI000CD88D21|nr:uncharacterized protein LOC111882003 [Lactuca sativa]
MARDKPESLKVEVLPPSILTHPTTFTHLNTPKQMHVNDTLTDKIYNDWAQEMKNFLFAKNKIGFIDGTISRPEAKSKIYMKWMRCDSMIKGWLTTAMDKDIRSSVKYANTTNQIYSDLDRGLEKKVRPEPTN